MNVAGQLDVLTVEQMQTVHEKACEILAKKGAVFESDATIDLFKKHGYKVEGHTVFFEQSEIERCVELAPSKFKLYAPNHEKDVLVGGDRILIHPNGGEVFMRDFDGTRRAATRKDFADLQKLYQALPNVDIGGYEPVSLNDVPERMRGIIAMYESFRNCDKPLLSPMSLETIQKKQEVLRLYNIGFGSDDYTDSHYVTWHIVCPNSPLVYSQFACDGIQVYAEANQPVVIVSAPMSGITSPVFPLATVILSIAEELAGLVLAQLIKPGVPVVVSASLTYGYMRSATWECAHPDTMLMLAASTQMQREFYHLPSRAQTGVTSSKCIDYQAGMETMQSFLYTALAGCDVTSQTAGSLANLMTSSLEKTVLDDELIARVRLLVGGITFNEEHMGLDQIFEEPFGGNFLEYDETVDYCRAAWVPTVSDWTGTDEWEAKGQSEAPERAHAIVQRILAEAPESVMDEERERAMLDYIAYIEKNA
ncbi:MAG: trimethylamine methyltransferase family protein [bacterium]|nr:trimethylamine methyltransferase family protein [bacterium]